MQSGSQAPAAIMLAAALGAAASAEAQTAPPAPPTEEIVVTGSQISRPGFKSPTPVTSLTPNDIARVGATNIADVLNQLPALKPSVTPSSVTNLSKLAGGNYLDLRGLTYLRTLTLIDGKRYVPTSPEGVVNTNLIPQALISSVDVVTGGASAAYGSDAVAGVVNLKLDNKLEGVRGSVQGGTSDREDHAGFLASVAFGKSFAGERAHVLLGFEAARNTGIRDGNSRSWAGNRAVINNPAYDGTNSQPELLHVQDARAPFATTGGLILSPGRLNNLQFLPGGTTAPFKFGRLVTDTAMDGGDGEPLISPYSLETPLVRRSAYGGVTYDLTDKITAYASVAYGRSSFIQHAIPTYDTFTIAADNAFLPAAVRNIMQADGLSSLTIGRGLLDYGLGYIDQKATTWQATGGVKGSLFGSWSFDASYAYGKTRTTSLFTGNINKTNRALAMDAVVNPATGGIVCRSTLTNPGNGCVPLNLFGAGAASPQALAYILGTSVRDWDIEQQVADLAIRGEPFSTWAGPVSVAFGGEWRRLTSNTTSDPDSIARRFRVGNTQPFDGRETVKEGFVEAVVPLATDESWAKNIDLNVAGRLTDYATSGQVETWKAGVNYAVNDQVRLRATRSRDIRAPNINELFAKGQTLFVNANDTALRQTYVISATTGGNPLLVPERADTVTAGIVLTPDFAQGLSLSVDYYTIRIAGAISTLGAQSVVDRCNSGQSQFCQLLTRGSDGRISSLRLAPANFQQISTRGVDLEVAYRMPLGEGMLDLHGLVNYTAKLDLVGDNDVAHFAGSTDQPLLDGVGGTPHWKASATASYSTDRYRVSVTERYVGGGVITRDAVTLDKNTVAGRFYTDLSGELNVYTTSAGGKVALFLGIQNLFDRDPPFTGYSNTSAYQLYDTIGRQYTAGVRFNF